MRRVALTSMVMGQAIRLIMPLFLLGAAGVAQATWPETLFAPTNGALEASAIAVDPSGNIIATNAQYGDVDISLVVAKFDRKGHLKWKTVAITGMTGYRKDQGIDIAFNMQGDAYITAPMYADGFDSPKIVKVSKSGVLKWQKKLVSSIFAAYGPSKVKCDSKGNPIVLTTYFYGSGSGHHALLTTKYDAAGRVVWQQSRDDVNHELENGSLDIDANDNVFAAGAWSNGLFLVKYRPLGEVAWERNVTLDQPTQTLDNLRVDGNGNCIIVGPESVSDGRVVISIIRPTGQIFARSVAQTTSYQTHIVADGTIRCFTRESNTHIGVTCLDRSGNLLWQTSINANGGELYVDNAGNSYLLRFFDTQSLLTKIDDSGDMVWTRSFDGAPMQFLPRSFTADPATGHAYISFSDIHSYSQVIAQF